VRQKVDVIVAATTTPAQAAKKSTATIPVVFLIIADPVAQGFVTSLARPGGNATGLASTAGPEIYGKMLQLLKEAVPRLTRVALLWNPTSPFGALFVREVGSAAGSVGVEVKALEAPRPEAFEDAFRAAMRERVGRLLVTPDPMFIAHRARLADLAARSRLPAVYGVRQHAEAGGLMVYTADFTDLYRRAGGYVAKILKGANPGDLPVEQPIKCELVINLKTARALGLTIPPSVLARADEILQ
jgi:putative tryptophan/tyrosine transport system substrate-binding protein